MSKSEGNKRKKNRSGNANVVKIVVAVVLVLAVAGYAIYVTGVIPRVLNGVTVTETMEDGSKKVVGKASVLETNFHFSGIFNQYYYYGQVTRDTLDDVKDESTGKTWRDTLVDETADNIMEQILFNNDAKKNGFGEFSQAARAAEMEANELSDSAKQNGYPSVSSYLAAAYGTGMSLRAYRQFLQNEIMVEEYQEYVKQFNLMPTNEEVRDDYDKNPNQYKLADFNFYFFSAETDDDGKAKNLDEVKKQAQKVADAAKDSDSFTQAVIDVLKERKEDSYAEALEKGEDTTFHEGMTASYLSSLNEKVTAYLFQEDNVGKAGIIEMDTGYYAVLLDALYQDTTATVSYRTLTLNVDTPDDATDDQIAKAVSDVEAKANNLVGSTRLSNFEFYNLVKANTDLSTEILSGGYVADGVLTNFVPSEEDEEMPEEEEEDAGETTAEKDEAKEAVGNWLFDSARQEGDTYVSVASDKKTVTIYFFINNVPSWAANSRSSIVSNRYTTWEEGIKGNSPAYVVNAGWVKTFAY